MEPEFIRYIASVVPGEIHKHEDRYQIEHSNGDVSTIWLKPAGVITPASLHQLCIFDEFDGADLFSSTFKIASTGISRCLNSVEITPTFAELDAIMGSEPLLSSTEVVPFMSEAGIWIYLLEPASSTIRKWNIEDHEECDSYPSLKAIIEEWVSVILEP